MNPNMQEGRKSNSNHIAVTNFNLDTIDRSYCQGSVFLSRSHTEWILLMAQTGTMTRW